MQGHLRRSSCWHSLPPQDSLVQPSRRPHCQQSVSLCFGPVCLGLGIVGRGGEGLSEYPPLTVGDLGTED